MINGAVHSKYTEEKSADSSDSKKIIVSESSSFWICKSGSTRYETDTVISCGYRL